MKLFCENCFSYLGPKQSKCPQCNWERPGHIRYLARGKPYWDNPIKLEGHPVGRPVFSHGLILVVWKLGRYAGGLSAIDVMGNIRWQARFNDPPVAEALVDGNLVYVCTTGLADGGSVYCFKIDTLQSDGELIWIQNNPDVIRGKINGNALIKENRLFVPCKEGMIICLDAVKKDLVPGWSGYVERDLHWLLCSHRWMIAVCRENGQFFQVDPLSGFHCTPIFTLNTRLSCQPLLWKDHLYAGTDDGRMLKIDIRRKTCQEFARDLKKVSAPPIVKNELIIAGANDHYVYAWDETGQLKWRSNFASRHAISSSPAAANDVVAIGSNDGNIYGIDIKTGEKIWAFDTGLGDMISRDVLHHEETFFIGVHSCLEDFSYLYALPWHLGEYTALAERQMERGNHYRAANLFTLAYHYAKNKNEKDEFAEKTSQNFVKDGFEHYSAAFWESLALFNRAAEYWQAAADLQRGKDNQKAAEFYYRASRMYWRLGQTDDEIRCASAAAELAKWPRLRLKPVNIPFKRIGDPIELAIRIENIGFAPAENLHFNIGGTLLERINFSVDNSYLDPDTHYDLTFLITPTREEDNIVAEVLYYTRDRAKPFDAVREVKILAKKVMRVDLGDMAQCEVKILNETGKELDIHTGDMVASKIELRMVQEKKFSDQNG